ncbi:MAG: ScpA family protein [Gammaproteobacteria bacterium]
MSEPVNPVNPVNPIEQLTQSPIPLALIDGQPFIELPHDLYIPPDALEIILEKFEGPLDLLLYLIKKQNLNILDIPIAKITEQYIKYIELMQEIRFELAAEYLLMAAMLAEIKSRMLLPRPKSVEGEEEEDPRAELVRRLQEYERFKKAAEDLENLPQQGRDTFIGKAQIPDWPSQAPLPQVTLQELLNAFKEVVRRAEMTASHRVLREPLSIRERMTEVLSRVRSDRFIEFCQLFRPTEGRMGVVVTFIAILELLKQSVIEMVQTEPFSQLHIKALA